MTLDPEIKRKAAEMSVQLTEFSASAPAPAVLSGSVPAPIVEGKDPTGLPPVVRQESALQVLSSGPAKLSAETTLGEHVSFDGFVSNSRGLWKILETDSGQETEKPMLQRICDPIRIIAQSRNETRTQWGIVVSWRDDDGYHHVENIPLELLTSNGEEVRKLFLQGNLRVEPSKRAREDLVRYLSNARVGNKVTLVSRCGWCGDCYVTPRTIYSSQPNELLFSSPAQSTAELKLGGLLNEWQFEIGKYAIGNGLMMLVLGAAFAAPLLSKLGIQGGGFHLRGPSSVGKSMLLRLGASVFSDASYMQTWRATHNGLEGIAAARNDGLLLLDELGESDPKSALATIYMLANGTGKIRANRAGDSRPPARWTLLFLSSGEISLGDLAASDRFSKNDDSFAGQDIRLLDIPADIGEHGVFNDLHGFGGGRALSEHLEAASARLHGTALDAYVRRLVHFSAPDFNDLSRRIEDRRLQLIEATDGGQVARAGRRFALISVAAELAGEMGVAPWTTQEAFAAIAEVFSAWKAARGGAQALEAIKAVQRIRDFLSTNASRFQNSNSSIAVSNRAGFAFNGPGKKFGFTVPGWKEALKGLDPKLAARALAHAGYLQGPDSSGKYSISRRAGGGQVRLYLIDESILQSE